MAFYPCRVESFYDVEGQNGKEAQTYSQNWVANPPGKACCPSRELAHSPNSCYEIEGHEDHIDDRKPFDQGIQIIVHDRVLSIHQATQYSTVDIRLFGSLLILNANVF